MAEPSDKLSSLFAKKKKSKKSTTKNATAIVKELAQAESASAAAPAPGTQSPSASKPAAAAVKKLSELTLGEKQDAEEKQSFQWAKQPKKYKNTSGPEGVARSWEEQEARNRTAKKLQLDSERAFPTLGADSARSQLSSMQAPSAKAVATKNVWSSLDHEEDSD